MPPVTLDELRRLRTRADPLADEAVAALVAGGTRPRPGENLLERVRAGARAEPALARFLEETHGHSAGLDPATTRRGRDAVLRHAPVSFLVLLAGSLVESFAVAEGAEVLVRTGRLLRDSERRIYETASLVRDMLLPDALLPGGRAHQALLRVRLLHAFVRRFVARSPGFDHARFGLPVNQADMLHTLLMFSCVLVDGIEKLGGALADDEKESWCRSWVAAGRLLGVEPALLPASAREERALHALVRTSYRPDDGSRALARAVLDALAGQPPFFLPRPAMEAVARRIVGDDLADALALPRSRPFEALAAGLARAWSVVDLVERALPAGRLVGVLGGMAFVEGNRWRILRSMPDADYGFRTA